MVVPYDLSEPGGVKRHAFHLAERMRRAGDTVTVVGPLSRGGPEPHVQGFGGVVNIPANGSANYMALLTPPWSVARYFRQQRFDVVHVHEPIVPMLAWYATWFSRTAARVATFHMYAETEGITARAARGCVAGALFPAFDAGIAVSRPAAEFAARFWRGPLPIIPNGVPTAIFHPGSGDAHAAHDAPLRLLFVGNWRDRRKGLAVLLAAYRELRAAGAAVTLDVIGDGTPDPDQAGLPGLTFHGPIGSESLLADHYRRCDLFVAPATGQESFGIVLLEAMSCGRALVCSDIRGYREVVDPEGAARVPAGDAGALARAIAALLGAPDRLRAMGARNRQRAETFDWDRISDQVREVYVEALAALAPAQRLGGGRGGRTPGVERITV